MALFGNKKIQDKKETTPKSEHVKADSVGVDSVSPIVPHTGDVHAYGAILNPHVSEKASNFAQGQKYIFRVNMHANKIDIKQAIEKLYKVNVTKVNVQNMPAKTRHFGRRIGIKSGFRKAIITLKEGQKIETV